MGEVTLQELFDQAWRGLAAQGWQSSWSDGRCAYRGENGRRCAVGHLIHDDEYSPGMEGLEVHALAEEGKLPARLVPHAWELDAIQDCHDHAYNLADMKRRMRSFAAQRGLTVPEVGDE